MTFAIGDAVKPKPLYRTEALPSGKVADVEPYPPRGQRIKVGRGGGWQLSGYFELDEQAGARA